MDAAIFFAAVLVSAPPAAPNPYSPEASARHGGLIFRGQFFDEGGSGGFDDDFGGSTGGSFEELPPPGSDDFGTGSGGGFGDGGFDNGFGDDDFGGDDFGGAPSLGPPPGGQPFVDPYAQPGQIYNGDPFTSPNQAFGPAGVPVRPDGSFSAVGIFAGQPYRPGWQGGTEVTYLFEADAGGPYGDLAITETDSEWRYTLVKGPGLTESFAFQFGSRLFNGPESPAVFGGLPSDYQRIGIDYALSFSGGGPWSFQVGFNPTLASDWDQGLSRDAFSFDGRGAITYSAGPGFVFTGGLLYWDRLNDRILPYGGIIWTPTPRWEIKAMFPRSRISYFWGPGFYGKPTFLYTDIEYVVESAEIGRAGRRDQLEYEDIRLTVGIREEWGGYQSFLEGGFVFQRDVDFKVADGGDFGIGDGFLIRGGFRY